MRIRTFDEVDPGEVCRLTNLAFGWRLTPDLVRRPLLRRDPAPVPGYAFYGVDARSRGGSSRATVDRRS